MFKKNNDTPTPLDTALTQALSDLQTLNPESDEYGKAVDHITKLTKLKDYHSPKRVSPDVLVTAGANLAGIVLILQYERVHVVASKALGFVMKLK